jgi:hypothetical protein
MRKTVYWSLLMLVLMTGGSCKKALNNIADYYPKVKLVSAVVQADSSVLVTATKLSDGAAPIDYIGFCCGTTPKPNMLSRQIIITSGNPTFSASFKGLNIDSTYHFNAWATNSYGYSYSNTITIQGYVAPPVTVPCSYTENYVDLGLGAGTDIFQSVGNPFNLSGQWIFNATTATGTTISFIFGAALANGTYTLTGSNNPGPGQVNFSYSSGSISATSYGGSGTVYVNTLSPGVFDLSICSALCQDNSTNAFYTIKMRMKTPT